MAGLDNLDGLRREARRRAQVAEEMAKSRQALRRFRFGSAIRHLRQVLELEPENKAAKQLLRSAKIRRWLQPAFLVVWILAVGWAGFMFVTNWGAGLWVREAPPPTATRTPTATRRATATRAATAEPSPTGTPILPSATPTPVDVRVEVLQTRINGEQATIELKVYKAGENLVGLGESDFALTYAGGNVPFSFQERNADDPVCIVVAVDNSGSIAPGLEEIRAAIDGLNDARKPDDELGLVLFAEPQNVVVEQEPSTSPLKTDLVTGTGDLTALWDGMLKGLEEVQTCSVQTRYLVVLTDGADTGSVRLTGDDTDRAIAIATEAEKQGVGVCTVGVESEALKEEPLQLAAYGCRYERASRFDDLVSLFQGLFGSVRHFYRIQVDLSALPSGASTLTLKTLGAVNTSISLNK